MSNSLLVTVADPKSLVAFVAKEQETYRSKHVYVLLTILSPGCPLCQWYRPALLDMLGEWNSIPPMLRLGAVQEAENCVRFATALPVAARWKEMVAFREWPCAFLLEFREGKLSWQRMMEHVKVGFINETLQIARGDHKLAQREVSGAGFKELKAQILGRLSLPRSISLKEWSSQGMVSEVSEQEGEGEWDSPIQLVAAPYGTRELPRITKPMPESVGSASPSPPTFQKVPPEAKLTPQQNETKEKEKEKGTVEQAKMGRELGALKQLLMETTDTRQILFPVLHEKLVAVEQSQDRAIIRRLLLAGKLRGEAKLLGEWRQRTKTGVADQATQSLARGFLFDLPGLSSLPVSLSSQPRKEELREEGLEALLRGQSNLSDSLFDYLRGVSKEQASAPLILEAHRGLIRELQNFFLHH